MAKRGEYIASKDNTSVGRSGINENVNNVKTGDLAGNNIMSLIMSFMPVIGDVQDAVDLKESIEDKDAVGMVLGAASLLPFVGSAATYANKARKLEKMKESVVSYYKDIAIPIYREVSNNKISKLDDGAKKAFQIMDKKKMDPERISDYLDYFEGIKPDELNAAKHAYEYMKYIDDFSDVADDRFNEISTSLVSREDLEKMGHGTARGLYDPETSTIYIRDDLDDDGIYYNLVHEIGHGIDKNDHLNKIESGIVIDDDGLNLIKRAYDVPSNISPKTDYEKRLYKSSESINEKIQTNRELRAKLYNMLKEEIGVEHPTLGELRTLIDEGGLSPKVTSNILSSLSGYGEVYAKNIMSGKQYEQNDLIKEALKGVPSVLLPYVLLNAYKEDNEKPDFKEGGWYPSDTLIDFLISKEGFEPRVRVPSKPNKKTGKKDKETTGYGVTDEDIVKRNKGKTITKSQAKKDFREAVRRRIGQFMEATPNFDKLNNNERDALFSYFYNIGYGGYTDQSPEFQKALSNLDKEKIALNIDFDYNNEDRKGAMKRRNAERRLFRLPVGEDFEFHIESDNYPEESNVIDNASIEPESDSILSAILSTKNDLELQDPISTTRGEAFKEARKRGLKEFTWNGKRYNTNIKKEGGAVDEENGSKYRYIASKDNTSVGSSGINENANYGTIPVDGVNINEIVAGGVPVVGDIMDVKDAYDSFIDRDALGMVMAAMGLIPFVGGISKKAMQAKRATKKLSQRDKELLGSLPDYAKPASPIGESWENHKKRLFSGAYERLTGEKLRMKNGEPDPDMLDTNIYDWDDPKVFRDAKYFLGDEYSDDEIREIIDEISGYGVLNGNIIRSKNVDKFIDLFLEGNPNISNKDVENFVKSHEVEHKIHYPDSGADKNGFDLNKIDDDEVKDYFKEDHFTEMAARGTQIKNYFGLTDDAQEVTPEMLEYAARNYLKDYGYDNEMKEYFESISDYKKAAKWITDHASVGLGAYYVGDRIADPKKEKKRNGGKLTPYKAGFRFIDHKKEYGDPKDASHRFPGRKFMYFYENDKPSKSIVFAEEGGVIGKQREAYDYFTNKRGMSKIQALAIIGNLMAESGLKDDIYGDNRTSYGIQQWHNERMDKLFKHAKKKGHSTPTFKDQLEFLADEYEGKTGYSNFLYTRKGKKGPGYYNYSRQDFMNADNLKDAVVAWNQGAGRPHKSVIRNDDRYNYAMEVAKNLGLDIEENSVSSYGQMGFGDDGEIAASVTLPEVEVAAALPNPEAPSPERQSEEERFRTWTETYGKDIVNHLLTLDGKKDGDDSDYSMMYKQHEKESEEDKKMALINAVLPNIQLRIKGVTDN